MTKLNDKHSKKPLQKGAVTPITNKVDSGLIPVNIKNHKDKKGGHPHIIIEDIDDKHVSVGLTTHLKKGKNSTNYTLENDPLGTGKKSFMRRQGIVAPQCEYVRPQKGQMTPKDYMRANEYGEKAKRKYIDTKDKKK